MRPCSRSIRKSLRARAGPAARPPPAHGEDPASSRARRARPCARRTARAQAVAVERGAYHAAVGEGNRSGPSQGSMSKSGRHRSPELGWELPSRHVASGSSSSGRAGASVRRASAARGRCRSSPSRASRTNHRQDLREVLAEELGAKRRLARAHPVDVAAQRVDLTVVGDHPVGMRELPAREGSSRSANGRAP